MSTRHPTHHIALLFAALAAAPIWGGCASSGSSRFDDEVVWQDDDKHPIDKPEEQEIPMYWSAADHTVFRPLSRFFLFEEAGPAANTNALGEVPNSSWYTNRLSVADLPPERVARGPCAVEPGPAGESWTIESGKIGGANPGFVIEDEAGDTYLLKFDNEKQTERATAADVIGSKIYWAAGFETPCNRIVRFEREQLKLADDATKEDAAGRKTPLTPEDVEEAMAFAPVGEDGLVRGMSSKFLPGEPLGPFYYSGTRDDDPNDVIPHEDRRELRGARVFSAWINHFDARDPNTFTSFITEGEGEDAPGYLQHFLLDFGDSFGSEWAWDPMSRRLGHAYYLDVGDVAADLYTLGLVKRPWDRLDRYEEGDIFGYFDVANFEPDDWKPGYPNPAFSRMDDVDAYWATKILSKFSDEHIRALVAEAKFTHPRHARYLERTLIGRRDAIVRHYFAELSPLDYPRVTDGLVCLEDLWVSGGYGTAEDAFYDVRIDGDAWRDPAVVEPDGRICVEPGADRDELVLEARVRRTWQDDPARSVRVHLRRVDGELRPVGVVRREAD